MPEAIEVSDDTLNVLVVDDHRLFRDGMKSLLLQWRSGIDLSEVGRVDEAVALLQRESYDLILLDLTLPDSLEPEQTMRRVVAAAGDTPVVAVSMVDQNQTITRAVQAGAQGFIRKSDSAGVMMATLDMVLAGGSAIPRDLLADGAGADTLSSLLSDRQLEVLRLIAQGCSNKEIARALDIAESTVKVHVHRILQLIGASSRAKAAAWAHQTGLTTTGEP